MKLTKQNRKSMVHYTIEKGITITLIAIALLGAIICLTTLMSCSSSDNEIDPDPGTTQTGTINGTVKDENGNPYPSALVKLSKGSDNLERATNDEGIYERITGDIGTYEVTLVPPLSTEVVSANPMTVNVLADQTVTVDFVIKPLPLEALLNFGNVDVFEEIRDKDGNLPTDSNEPLYAANFFQDPIGLLTAIKAPDGHHVTLSEFQKAKGDFKVHCNGKTSTVEITLEGMIPGGTYTTWLGYFNTPKKVGESISPADFVFPVNPPLGASNGTENVLIAGADGTIKVTVEHASCILTDAVALGMPISYHLNGKTFGGGEIPDIEEVTQLVVFFQ